MRKINIPLIIALLLLSGFSSTQAQVYGQSDLLGTQRLSEKSKRDSVRVMRAGTMYSGIQVEVVGAGNILKRVTVQFEDRSSENFNEGRFTSKGPRTDVLWFRSRGQAINKISLLYNPDVPVNEGAEVRVYGVR